MPGRDIEDARAQRAEQPLVAGDAEEVDHVGLDVERNVADGLSGIDDQRDVVFAGDGGDLAERLEGAGDVGGVGDGDQAGIGADGAADVVGVDQASERVDGDACLSGGTKLLQAMERAEDRVVIDPGADAVGLSAVLKLMKHQALDGVVERIGTIEGEDKVLGILAVEECAQASAAFGQDRGRGLGFAIRAPAGRGADIGGVSLHCFEHGRRLGKARGRVIHVSPGGHGVNCSENREFGG